jgi:hypothetical protein
VLAAVGDEDLGEAAAINDAAAGVGALLLVFLVPVLVGVTDDDLEEALAGRDHPAMLVTGGLGLLAALSPGCSSRSPRCRGAATARPPPARRIHSCGFPSVNPCHVHPAGMRWDSRAQAVLVPDPPVKPSGSRPTKAS